MNKRTQVKHFLTGLLVAASGVAFAATFPLFSPANGVLKGNASTYVTSAAVSADIRAMWTGSCDATTFLRGEGACAQVSLTTNVSGLLPVPNGGTGQGSLSADNLFMGAGTGAMVAKAIPSCSTATSAITYDTGTHTWGCNTVAGGVTGLANPTASVGLTAVNGVASTAMRSDGAPALSQSISPTWSGAHIFSQVVTANAINNSYLASSTTPGFVWEETDASATNKRWFTFANGAQMRFSAIADAAFTAADYLTVSRSGVAISNLSLGNATDNPTFSFLGTGATAFSGNVTVAGSSVCRANGTNCPAAVTSISAGTGITNSPNPIVGTGTVSVDQSFSPTWTGTHSFTSTVTTPLTVAASNANQHGVLVQNTNTGATAFTVVETRNSTNSAFLGVSSTGYSGAFYPGGPAGEIAFVSTGAIPLVFATNGNARMTISTAGTVAVIGSNLTVNGNAVCQSDGTNCPAGSVEVSTTQTGTVAGCTTAPTNTFRFVKRGNMVIMSIDGQIGACTSNSTGFSSTGAVPAAFQPARVQQCLAPAEDNTVTGLTASIGVSAASSTVTYTLNNASGNWTAAGTKAIFSVAPTCAYSLL